MQNRSKLMLTIMVGGVLMGAALSRMATPVMQFAAEPDWRQSAHADFSATPWQFSASLPEDLNPLGWTVSSYAAPPRALSPDPLPLYESPDFTEPIADEAVYESSEEAAVTAASLDEPPSHPRAAPDVAAGLDAPPTLILPPPDIALAQNQ